MIEQALFAHLSDQDAVTAIVGGGDSDGNARIYPVRMPDKTTKPAIVYRRISSPREATSQGQTIVVPARFQLDMYGPDFDQVRTLANAVREALIAFHGWMGESDGAQVQGCFLDNEADDPVADDLKQFHTRQDWIIWYEE
jgi:hypothetical protein